ncbi:hypothetical protein [Sansalvadorimonas verongulae]|uniref:hypothetical protein n=1 Tax=Sansalvadorimonas verongulae TaxID=2172824 RepID=UPI0012BC21C6|nr:hypothetical protein [Sansalvadorimonas verongulae]MTI13246.1 hypothetical protein [Sansalvadorimonas verongulae]
MDSSKPRSIIEQGSLSGQTAIDSMNLLIPINKISKADKRLGMTVAPIYLETGELAGKIDESTNTVTVEGAGGVSTSYRKTRQSRGKGGGTTEYISVTVFSKQLEGDYLQGITAANVAQAHKYIQDQCVIDVPVDQFLSAKVADCDFKQDVYVDIPSQKVAGQIKKMVRPEFANLSKATTSANTKKHQLHVSTHSSGTHPYFKVYGKELELDTQSNDFKAAFLKESDYVREGHSLQRVEITMRTTKKLVEYGVLRDNEENTLGNVLAALDDGRGLEAIKKLESRYLDVRSLEDVETAAKPEDKDEMKIYNTVKRIFKYAGDNTPNKSAVIDDVLEIHIVSKGRVAKYKRLAEYYYDHFTSPRVTGDDVAKVQSVVSNPLYEVDDVTTTIREKKASKAAQELAEVIMGDIGLTAQERVQDDWEELGGALEDYARLIATREANDHLKKMPELSEEEWQALESRYKNQVMEEIKQVRESAKL